jgi:hypothetical protein
MLLSIQELLLHEYLHDQILFLQELLEPSLMPRIIDKLLGRELVAPLPRPRPSQVLCRWRAGWQRGVQW